MDKPLRQRGKIAGADREHRPAVDDLRHPGVGLHYDRLRRDFREPFHERKHPVGAKPAVEAVRVDAERLEKRRDALDRCASEKLSRLVERNRREHREGGVQLCREDRGLELARIAHRLDEHEIRAGRSADAHHLRESPVGRVEFEIAGRLQEPSGRADVERHPAFRDVVGDRIARFYYVDGRYGEPRKIALDRDLVIWDH